MSAPTDEREHGRQALEHAALEIVGALSPAEDGGWFRQHTAAGCTVCQRAIDQIAVLHDQLLLSAPPVEPPASLRTRLLAAVRSAPDSGAADSPAEDIQVWNRWAAPEVPKFTTVPASEAGWEETGIAGITVRSLHVDNELDSVTMMVRMAAGTAWPNHRHAGDEQCYVIAGDLKVEDQVLRAGDYQFAPADSVHGTQSTEGGCTLLIVSSRHDEILSG